MISIVDFMEIYYGYRPVEMFTLKQWEDYKKKHDIEEWDYPLDEYKHIAENDIDCEPVEFEDDYRFCEIPSEEE